MAAAVKVTTAVHRMEQGNFSNVKGVGAGVYEYRIDFGPGYRVHFGKDGDRLAILLASGTEKRQDTDIASAGSQSPEGGLGCYVACSIGTFRVF